MKSVLLACFVLNSVFLWRFALYFVRTRRGAPVGFSHSFFAFLFSKWERSYILWKIRKVCFPPYSMMVCPRRFSLVFACKMFYFEIFLMHFPLSMRGKEGTIEVCQIGSAVFVCRIKPKFKEPQHTAQSGEGKCARPADLSPLKSGCCTHRTSCGRSASTQSPGLLSPVPPAWVVTQPGWTGGQSGHIGSSRPRGGWKLEAGSSRRMEAAKWKGARPRRPSATRPAASAP